MCDEKRCNTCKVILPIENFRAVRGGTGTYSKCSICMRKESTDRTRAYRARKLQQAAP